MGIFDDAPGALVAVGLCASVVGVLLLLLLGWHVLRRILDRPRVPLGAGTYVVLGLACAGACGLGATALGTAAFFLDYERVENPTRLARLRCTRGGPRRVHLTVLPLAGRATEERFELEGERCAMVVELLRLGPLPARLGAGALWRVAKAGDQERPRRNPLWLTPAPGSPSALVVRDATVRPVEAPLDEHATYMLVLTPDGVAIERPPPTPGKLGT
jgi:hypothetical protein